MQAVISNIQRFSLHDGPGVRTTVFFQGCPMRCVWCHNPETLAFGSELYYDRRKCAHCGSCFAVCPTGSLARQDDGLAYAKSLCSHCHACASECPGGALSLQGVKMSTEDILREASLDTGMYNRTGGGVTLSGGEATAQPGPALELICELKKAGIHVALDTCGFCSAGTFRMLCESADLILFDIKHADPETHRKLTGQTNELILGNLRQLNDMGVPVEVRIPIVPGLNDDIGNIHAMAGLIAASPCVISVVLLGYHPLGQAKQNGFEHGASSETLRSPGKKYLAELAQIMRDHIVKPVSFR